MYSFYKPSGKFSFLFLPCFILSIIVIVPIFSYLQALILLYSPFVILSLILMIICVISMMFFCQYLCIVKGKLRNKAVAAVVALLIGLLFSFLSIVFYSADGEINIILKNINSMFLNPAIILNSIEQVFDTGFVLTRSIARTSITVRGIWLIIITFTGNLIMQIFLISCFRARAGEPFMEQKKQWSKEIELKFEFVTNKTEFIERVSSEDYFYIDKLVLQSEGDKNHSIFEIYPMDTYYCLSVKNQKADGSDKNGEMKFDSDTVVEYLIISKSIGDILLAKKQSNETISS